MIHRTFDATLLNVAANHPDVHPWTGAADEIDLGPLVSNIANFALIAECGGGFLLISLEPGLYEVHSMFPPEARRGSIRAMHEGFDYMFTRTDCEKIVTQVPDNNPAAAALAKLAKFRPMFRREATPRGPTAYVGLTVDEWAQENASLEVDGRWFHERTDKVLKLARPDLPDHPADNSHDRTVGAAVRILRAGNVGKAVGFYNRWARFAGYSPIALLSEQPVVLDMSEPGVAFVVEVRDGDMEVLLCR